MSATYNSLLPHRLPTPVQGVYSELVQRLQHDLDTPPPLPQPRKVPVRKVINGRTYWYWQWRESGKQVQKYIGKDTDPVTQTALAAAVEQAPPPADAKANLCELLRGLFGQAVTGPMARVLKELGADGLARTNALVVGTYAFIAYQGSFAIKWPQFAMTEDIDLAAWPLPSAFSLNLYESLQRTTLGFEPARRLDTAAPPVMYVVPNTHYRVDVLTPMVGRPHHDPIQIPSIRAHAEPLRYLDFLIDEPTLAAFPIGSGVLVRIPAPGRYAFHKLLIAPRRPTLDKRQKDVAQARTLLALLVMDDPAEVQSAWKALSRKPKSWAAAVTLQMQGFPADLKAELSDVLGIAL